MSEPVEKIKCRYCDEYATLIKAWSWRGLIFGPGTSHGQVLYQNNMQYRNVYHCKRWNCPRGHSFMTTVTEREKV